jgi:tetratricopeptide (TPR) repeat protein
MSVKRIALLVVLLTVLGGGYYAVRRFMDVRKLQAADKNLFLRGDFEGAIANYTDLIKRHPEKAGLYYKRGDAYVHLGRYLEAVGDYRSALQNGIDDSLQAMLRIGLAQKSLSDWPSAKQTFHELLGECGPGDSTELWASHYHLGQVEYKLGNYREALLQYGKALEYSTSKLPLYHRANAYAAIGLKDSAIADYNASIVFAKHDYIRAHPNSSISRCDTCGFPFGSKEYDLLTERARGTVLEVIQQAVADSVGGEELRSIKNKLESARH